MKHPTDHSAGRNSSNILKLMVVEDHTLFKQGLISLLSAQADITVVGEAGLVSEAIEVATEIKPDVILLDLELPDGNGLEAIKPVLAASPHTRIIILSVFDTDELLFTAIRMGAKGYLLKNTPVSSLLSAVRSLAKGEAALSRRMTARIIDELSRLGTIFNFTQPATPKMLTNREVEILTLLGTGISNREIARNLLITENTVKIHVHNILEKLKLRNRAEAALFARRQGLRPLVLKIDQLESDLLSSVGS